MPAKTPLLSCVMPTANRPQWLKRAVDLYLGQYMAIDGRTELIIVETGDPDSQSEIGMYGELPGITHVITQETNLGQKMNLGVSISQGHVIQKLDDDDYYAPTFLRRSYHNVLNHGPDYISGCRSYLGLIQGVCGVYLLHDWFASGTLAFYKSVWELVPFPKVDKAVGKWFLIAHPNLKRCYLDDPELYLFVRHGSSTWQKYHGDHSLTTVEDEILKSPRYSKELDAFMPQHYADFYQSLALTGVV